MDSSLKDFVRHRCRLDFVSRCLNEYTANFAIANSSKIAANEGIIKLLKPHRINALKRAMATEKKTRWYDLPEEVLLIIINNRPNPNRKSSIKIAEKWGVNHDLINAANRSTDINYDQWKKIRKNYRVKKRKASTVLAREIGLQPHKIKDAYYCISLSKPQWKFIRENKLSRGVNGNIRQSKPSLSEQFKIGQPLVQKIWNRANTKGPSLDNFLNPHLDRIELLKFRDLRTIMKKSFSEIAHTMRAQRKAIRIAFIQHDEKFPPLMDVYASN